MPNRTRPCSFRPNLPNPPETATFTARPLVTGRDLYRGVALHGIRTTVEYGALIVTGLAVNAGTETASIVGLNLLLCGPDGRPLWADTGFVEINSHPGQSAPFRLELPLGTDISVVADVPDDAIAANGRAQETDLAPLGAADGTIPRDPATGYSHLRLLLTSMTHDPLF